MVIIRLYYIGCKINNNFLFTQIFVKISYKFIFFLHLFTDILDQPYR